MKANTIFFNKTYQQLMEATSAAALFGDLHNLTPEALKRCFRMMAQQIHPDHHPHFKKAANDAFLKLQYWYDSALFEMQTRQGGLKFESKNSVYVTTAVSQKGDLCDIYPAQMTPNQKVILKVVRHSKNNDLMMAESQALKRIQNHLKNDRMHVHFPMPLDSFKVKDSAGAERNINVLNVDGEFVTLADIIQAYPKGIHPADAAWMFNRLLATLAKTHELGLVHGAVLPTHLLLNLKDHNGRLIDWCYAVQCGQKIKAISPPYKHFYPAEVFEKRPVTPATDIFMAAMSLLSLLGGNVQTRDIPAIVPKPMVAFLRACLLPAPHRRPQNSWTLFDDFQEVLQRLYGAPSFRPFSLDDSNL